MKHNYQTLASNSKIWQLYVLGDNIGIICFMNTQGLCLQCYVPSSPTSCKSQKNPDLYMLFIKQQVPCVDHTK